MSNNPISNFGDTFLSKLKEQSFTIIILVGIMWYQNNLFTTQMREYRSIIDEKEKLVLKLKLLFKILD